MSDVDLSRLSPQVTTMVRLALDLKWRARQQRNGGLILTAPSNSSVQVAVPPIRQWNEAKLRTMTNKIVKYGDQSRWVAMQAANEIPEVKMGTDTLTGQKIFSEAVEDVRRDHGDDVEDILTEEQKKFVHDQDHVPDNQPAIVSEKPWMAHRGSPGPTGGQVYPSDAVIERKWSDGSMDYACSWPECDYTSAHARSVARHYAASASHSKVGPQTPSMVDPSYVEPVSAHRSSASRVTKLQREILAAIEDIAAGEHPMPATPTTLSQALAERIIAARDEAKQPDDDELPEPKTPEQIIELIRRLVDDGSYLFSINQVAEIRMEKDRALGEAQKEKVEMSDRITELEHQVKTTEHIMDTLNANVDLVVKERDELKIERDLIQESEQRLREKVQVWKSLIDE